MQDARKHTLASTAGTLPDAKLLSNFEWFGNEKSATILTAHISKIIAEADLHPSDEAITFCKTGHWAATNWFVLSELEHFRTVKLYPVSMVEWSNHGREMENTPSQLANLWAKVTGK